MHLSVKFVAAGAIAFAVAASPSQGQGGTLEILRQRGSLNCGVNSALPGFSQSDGQGHWQGFDVDYCKAIAAATLGNPNRVNYVPLDRLERFTSLQSGAVDVLIRNSTWTSTRDTSAKLSFVGVNYYDGQGFLVKVSRAINSVNGLNGKTICVGTGTTNELNLVDYFASHSLAYTPLTFATHDETVRAYLADRCATYSADASSLYSVRVQQVRPKDHIILSEIISKEPLGPAVRQDDPQWFTVVKWVHFSLLNAEELGVTQANVEQMTASNNPSVRRLLGSQGEFGEALGLASDFSVKMLKAVGNYGEIFERNLGTGSRLRIDRGLNKLWTQGGLQYAPPIR